MSRIDLLVYTDPGQVEVLVNIRRKDGFHEKITPVIDTGAETSLLPAELLDIIVYRLSENSAITIEQAGIARQSFTATEAHISVFLEDRHGNRTREFEILAWFAVTRNPLLGFSGILDQAILHIDMPKREGWVEIS